MEARLGLLRWLGGGSCFDFVGVCGFGGMPSVFPCFLGVSWGMFVFLTPGAGKDEKYCDHIAVLLFFFTTTTSTTTTTSPS